MSETLNADELLAILAKRDELEEKNSLLCNKMFAEIKEQTNGLSEAFFEIRTQMDKNTEQIKELSKNIGGIGKSNGEFAEEYFYNSLEKKMEFAGIHFDDISNKFGFCKKLPNKKEIKAQFDIVLRNGSSLAIIEVKYKADSEDVKEIVEKKIPKFRTLYPEYAGYKLYLGLASMSFNEYVVKEAKEFGVGLLKAVGDVVEFQTEWVRTY